MAQPQLGLYILTFRYYHYIFFITRTNEAGVGASLLKIKLTERAERN